MSKNFFVYILASHRNGTLYVGMTSDIAGRVYIHREDILDGFTRRYGVHRLVWFEWAEFAEPAICAKSRSRNGGAAGRSA